MAKTFFVHFLRVRFLCSFYECTTCEFQPKQVLDYIRTTLNLTNSYILFHLTIYEEYTQIKFMIFFFDISRIRYLSFKKFNHKFINK